MTNAYTAFIFARGGSKGIHQKNIKSLAGKPLIAHSIETGLKSKFIEKIVVSTDDDRIAQVSQNYGAHVIKRPNELAGDESAEVLAWRHTIGMMPDYFSHEENLFISLPATSPLRTVGDIDNAITTYNSTKSDLVLAISPSHRSPYLNMVECDKDGSIKVILDGKGAFRRQDVPDVYDITTLIYVSTAEYIMNCSSILEGVVGYIKVPYERAIDIDFPADLVIAEALLNYQLAED